MFRKLIDWFRSLWSEPTNENDWGDVKSKALPAVYFTTVNIVQKPPRNDEIKNRELYYVESDTKPKWTLFQCPCGCGTVITLSLQPIHRPFWKLMNISTGRVTLHPSVWRDKGCLSHFWVKDGRIIWCTDTGTHPLTTK